jgi:hypothetical protein
MRSRRTLCSSANAVITHLSAAIVLYSFVGHAGAQNWDRTIKIAVLDGRNGEPIKETHLLVFAGDTVEELRRHSRHFDLHTNESGNAELVLTSDSYKFVQVWVDGMILCQSQPNAVSLDLGQVLAIGLLAPNECGKLHTSRAPGQLLVFARFATLREKMER